MQMLLLNARKQAHLPPQECPIKKAAGKAGSMCLPRACIWLTNQPANWLRTVGFVDCVTSRLFWEASGRLTAKTTSTDGLLLLLLACACQYELDSATCMKLFLFKLPQPFHDAEAGPFEDQQWACSECWNAAEMWQLQHWAVEIGIGHMYDTKPVLRIQQQVLSLTASLTTVLTCCCCRQLC